MKWTSIPTRRPRPDPLSLRYHTRLSRHLRHPKRLISLAVDDELGGVRVPDKDEWPPTRSAMTIHGFEAIQPVQK